MNKIYLFLVNFAIILCCYCTDDVNDFIVKYCDKNLPDTKLAMFEKCERLIPKKFRDKAEKCLIEQGSQPSYKEIRNTFCDDSKRDKYNKCLIKETKNFNTTRTNQKFTEALNNYEMCMDKAMKS